MERLRMQPGSLYPIDATFDATGVNFSLFLANAEKVELCVFDEFGRQQLMRFSLPVCEHHLWHTGTFALYPR